MPVITALNALDEDALVRIMTEPKNALVKQYQQIFAMDHVELEIEEEALRKIAKKTLEYNTGARGLRSVMEKLLMKYMYDIPSDATVSRIVITEKVVDGTGEPEIDYDPERKANPTSEKAFFAKKQKA